MEQVSFEVSLPEEYAPRRCPGSLSPFPQSHYRVKNPLLNQGTPRELSGTLFSCRSKVRGNPYAECGSEWLSGSKDHMTQARSRAEAPLILLVPRTTKLNVFPEACPGSGHVGHHTWTLHPTAVLCNPNYWILGKPVPATETVSNRKDLSLH